MENFYTKKELVELTGKATKTLERFMTKNNIKSSFSKGVKKYYNEEVKDFLVNNFKKKTFEDTVKEINAQLYKICGYYPYIINSFKDGKYNVTCRFCNDNFNISRSNMKNGAIKENGLRYHMCKTCGQKRSNDANTKDIEHFKRKIEERYGFQPYEILEFTKLSEKSKLKCKKCNDVFIVKAGNILITKNKIYCPSCNNMKRSNKSYQERLDEIFGGKLIALEEYKGRRIPIMHKCLNCNNKWKIDPNNRLNGEGCPKCSNIFTQSKGEKEIIDFISKNYKGEIILRNRSILNGKELDIYLPELKIAIEYDGLYWHNEKHKGKNYHIDKTRKCKEHGVRLIHVFEDEWVNKNELVKFKLLHILGINNQEKIYARKCYIEEIDSSLKNEFLERNHIQGKDNASIKLGLWLPKEDGDELIAIMTFVKRRLALGSKHKGEFDYELSRFATDRDYRAIGAFGKLFKYFIKNYEYDSIITYADIRWSEGNVYIKNNFEYTHDSRPNYWYVDRNDGTKRIHRFNFRKQELKNKFPELYDNGLTEFEIMDNTNFYRIWDCGNMVFKYEKKK